MAGLGHKVVDPKEYQMGKRYGQTREWGKGFSRPFNKSEAIRSLTPYKDAIKAVRQLYEEGGYVLHVITALSLEPEPHAYRIENLNNLFGKGVVDRLVCTDPDGHKEDALAEYKDTDCIWIEDSVENAIAGSKLGLDTVLMGHQHNEWVTDEELQEHEITRVYNWEQLLEEKFYQH